MAGKRYSHAVRRKTVYNDRDALREAGVPIECGVEEGEARWWLLPGAKKKTVTLTLAEGQVLPLGLTKLALSFLKGTELYHEIEAVHEKLTLGATEKTRKQLEEITRKLAIVPHGPKIYREKEDVLDDILDGLVKNRRLRIEYRAPGSEPFRVWALACRSPFSTGQYSDSAGG